MTGRYAHIKTCSDEYMARAHGPGEESHETNLDPSISRIQHLYKCIKRDEGIDFLSL